MSLPHLEVRRAADRFVTVADGRVTRHSFSFDRHYDPANVSFGPLIAFNDDTLFGGQGYPEHSHRDVEIVTWVLEGFLRHEDSTGRRGVIGPGQVQRLSAGTGVRHSEVNNSPDLPVRFLQMWLRPDENGLTPTYEQRDVEVDSEGGGWVSLASGTASHSDIAAVRLNSSRATLRTARLGVQEQLALPGAGLLHLFVARGRVEVELLGDLDTGDALRLSRTGGHTITGLAAVGREADVDDGAEVLLWELTP